MAKDLFVSTPIARQDLWQTTGATMKTLPISLGSTTTNAAAEQSPAGQPTADSKEKVRPTTTEGKNQGASGLPTEVSEPEPSFFVKPSTKEEKLAVAQLAEKVGISEEQLLGDLEDSFGPFLENFVSMVGMSIDSNASTGAELLSFAEIMHLLQKMGAEESHGRLEDLLSSITTMGRLQEGQWELFRAEMERINKEIADAKAEMEQARAKAEEAQKKAQAEAEAAQKKAQQMQAQAAAKANAAASQAAKQQLQAQQLGAASGAMGNLQKQQTAVASQLQAVQAQQASLSAALQQQGAQLQNQASEQQKLLQATSNQLLQHAATLQHQAVAQMNASQGLLSQALQASAAQQAQIVAQAEALQQNATNLIAQAQAQQVKVQGQQTEAQAAAEQAQAQQQAAAQQAQQAAAAQAQQQATAQAQQQATAQAQQQAAQAPMAAQQAQAQTATAAASAALESQGIQPPATAREALIFARTNGFYLPPQQNEVSQTSINPESESDSLSAIEQAEVDYLKYLTETYNGFDPEFGLVRNRPTAANGAPLPLTAAQLKDIESKEALLNAQLADPENHVDGPSCYGIAQAEAVFAEATSSSQHGPSFEIVTDPATGTMHEKLIPQANGTTQDFYYTPAINGVIPVPGLGDVPAPAVSAVMPISEKRKVVILAPGQYTEDAALGGVNSTPGLYKVQVRKIRPSTWDSPVFSAIRTVVSVVYPPLGVALAAMSAAIAAKKGNWVGAAMSAASAVAGGFKISAANSAAAAGGSAAGSEASKAALKEAAQLAATGQKINVATAAASAGMAIKNGDILGAVTSGASAVGGVASLNGQVTFGQNLQTVANTGASAIHAGKAIKNGDILGAVANGANAAGGIASLSGNQSLAQNLQAVGAGANLAGGVVNKDWAQAVQGGIGLSQALPADPIGNVVAWMTGGGDTAELTAQQNKGSSDSLADESLNYTFTEAEQVSINELGAQDLPASQQKVIAELAALASNSTNTNELMATYKKALLVDAGEAGVAASNLMIAEDKYGNSIADNLLAIQKSELLANAGYDPGAFVIFTLGQIQSNAMDGLAELPSTQGKYNTCAASILTDYLAAEMPAEFVRIAAGMFTQGSGVLTATGAPMETNVLEAIALKNEYRGPVRAVFDSAFMELANGNLSYNLQLDKKINMGIDPENLEDQHYTMQGTGMNANEQILLYEAVFGVPFEQAYPEDTLAYLSTLKPADGLVGIGIYVGDKVNGQYTGGHAVRFLGIENGQVLYADPRGVLEQQHLDELGTKLVDKRRAVYSMSIENFRARNMGDVLHPKFMI